MKDREREREREREKGIAGDACGKEPLRNPVKAAARRFLHILKSETPLGVVLAGKFDWRDLCALGFGGWGQLYFFFCFKFWKIGVKDACVHLPAALIPCSDTVL